MSDSLKQHNSGDTPPIEDAASAEARTLAAAYAFGAADQADAEQLREAMSLDAGIGDEVQAYRRLFTLMHYTALPVAPPDALAEQLRAATSPASSPIIQSYTGPGSEAAMRDLEDEALFPYAPGLSGPRVDGASAQEGERIGYWPSTTPPAGSTRAQPPANPFVANAGKVNPLTGKPMSSAAQASPPLAATSADTRYSAQRVPVATAAVRQQTQRMAQQKPAQQAPAAYAAIPEAFRAIPIAPPTNGSGRSGAWLGWSAALVALALLLVTNYYWYTTSQQSIAQQRQGQTQIAQLQTEIATTQEREIALQQEVDSAAQNLASTQAIVDQLRADLDESRELLADAEESLAAIVPQAETPMGMSDDTLSALAQGSLEDAMLQPMNSTDAMTATARIVWNPDMQSGVLIAMNMPTLEADRTYQLWLVSGGVPTSAGMFTVDDKGMGMLELSDMPIGDYEVAAVTTEPMTGSPAPTSTILIAGEL